MAGISPALALTLVLSSVGQKTKAAPDMPHFTIKALQPEKFIMQNRVYFQDKPIKNITIMRIIKLLIIININNTTNYAQIDLLYIYFKNIYFTGKKIKIKKRNTGQY